MANKVTVVLIGSTTPETITGVTSVVVEASPARLVVTYTDGGVTKTKVFNWDRVEAYKVEPDS